MARNKNQKVVELISSGDATINTLREMAVKAGVYNGVTAEDIKDLQLNLKYNLDTSKLGMFRIASFNKFNNIVAKINARINNATTNTTKNREESIQYLRETNPRKYARMLADGAIISQLETK